MVKIPEILNHSEDLSEDNSSLGSTAPSSLSLMGSSSSSINTNTLGTTTTGSIANGTRRVKLEPKAGLAEEIKHNIESDLPNRYNKDPSNNIVNESDRSTSDSDGPNKEETFKHNLKHHFPKTLPLSKINKKLLSKKLVQVAIRRKSSSQLKDPITRLPINHTNSKLHTKSLEAGLRVKLTLAPDLYSLYNSLTPHTNRKQCLQVYNSNDPNDQHTRVLKNENCLNDINLNTKTVQLIDNNLVNLSVFSNKILKTFKPNCDKLNEADDNKHSNGKSNKSNKTANKSNKSNKGNGQANNNSAANSSTVLPTFNSLDTAVHNLFGIDEYSLVRITRSTTTDHDGSVLLKFETAKPGELNLIDDEEFTDDLLHSIGKPNETPSNLFIKKVVARPRYKSDMKLYLIPKNINSSLYVDSRMFERDLINGIIDINLPFYKNIYCTFEFDHIVKEFTHLLELTKRANHEDHAYNQSQIQNNDSSVGSPNYLQIQHLNSSRATTEHLQSVSLPNTQLPISVPTTASGTPLVSPSRVSDSISPSYDQNFFSPPTGTGTGTAITAASITAGTSVYGTAIAPIKPSHSVSGINSIPTIPDISPLNVSNSTTSSYTPPNIYSNSNGIIRLPPIVPKDETNPEPLV